MKLATAKVTKVGSGKVAQEVAKEKGLLYGVSCFGGWFVGTYEELDKIGVVEKTDPNKEWF